MGFVDYWASWCGFVPRVRADLADRLKTLPDVVHAVVDTEAERELQRLLRSDPLSRSWPSRTASCCSTRPALPPAGKVLESLVQQLKALRGGGRRSHHPERRAHQLPTGAPGAHSPYAARRKSSPGTFTAVSLVLVEHPRPEIAQITLNCRR